MRKLLVTILCFSVYINVESHKTILSIDEQWVCNIKKSCLECLRQSHCTWCPTENKCFSSKLNTDGFCKNDFIVYEDYGFSIDENAACKCSVESSEQERTPLCRPPGAADSEPACSGRGVCSCGRCRCPAPDPDHPTKVVMGEYCEFDNFSCDEPECDEGPYPLVPPPAPDADNATSATASAAVKDELIETAPVPENSDPVA